MKNMKKWIAAVAISMFVLAGSIGSADAITIDLIQNGGFEEGGGSFSHWNTYGDVSIVDDGSGNHFARIGVSTTGLGGVMTQWFDVESYHENQTLGFEYSFNFIDMPTSYSFFDVFAVSMRTTTNGIVEEYLSLASYDTSTWANTSGSFTDVLNPQLAPGTYHLKFKLQETSSLLTTDSYVDVDNVALNVTVPEPNTLLLLGSALVGVAALGRGLRKKGK